MSGRRGPLPARCLLAVFGQMPLNDRLNAYNVSFRWSVLIRKANLSVRAVAILVGSKNTLKHCQKLNDAFTIISSSPSLNNRLTTTKAKPLCLSDWNVLKMVTRPGRGTRLSTANMTLIAIVFPSVKELLFFNHTYSDIEYLAQLLEQPVWQQQIDTLKFFENSIIYDKSSTDVRGLSYDLFYAINDLPALKSLTLLLHDIKLTNLSVLLNLEAITFQSFYKGDRGMLDFTDQLEEYAYDNEDLMIAIPDSCFTNVHKRRQQFPEVFRNQIVSLSSGLYTKCTYSALLLFCEHFTSIRTLNFEVEPSFVCQLFEHLSLLPSLVHLGLSIDFEGEAMAKYEAIPPQDQLPSVLALDLDVKAPSHKQLQWLNLSWTFPKLEAMDIGVLTDDYCRPAFMKAFLSTGLPLHRISFRYEGVSSTLEKFFGNRKFK